MLWKFPSDRPVVFDHGRMCWSKFWFPIPLANAEVRMGAKRWRWFQCVSVSKFASWFQVINWYPSRQGQHFYLWQDWQDQFFPTWADFNTSISNIWGTCSTVLHGTTSVTVFLGHPVLGPIVVSPWPYAVYLCHQQRQDAGRWRRRQSTMQNRGV